MQKFIFVGIFKSIKYWNFRAKKFSKSTIFAAKIQNGVETRFLTKLDFWTEKKILEQCVESYRQQLPPATLVVFQW